MEFQFIKDPLIKKLENCSRNWNSNNWNLRKLIIFDQKFIYIINHFCFDYLSLAVLFPWFYFYTVFILSLVVDISFFCFLRDAHLSFSASDRLFHSIFRRFFLSFSLRSKLYMILPFIVLRFVSFCSISERYLLNALFSNFSLSVFS